jgi:type IV pilus assembly protein PilE
MNRSKGFTLIELLLVVAIIGILAAVAIPSYSKYVVKAHRTSAINGLLELASRQARYYTTNNKYATNMTVLGYASNPMPLDSAGSRYFDLSVESVTANGFVLKAVPYDKQTTDSCGTFKYTDLGVRSVTGTSATVKECWKQ